MDLRYLVVDGPAFLGVLPGHVVLALLLVFPALALLPAYFALDTGCVRLISLMWLEDVIPIHSFRCLPNGFIPHKMA